MSDQSKHEQIPEIIEELLCPYCREILKLCPECFVHVCPCCARKYADENYSEAIFCEIVKENGLVTIIPEGMPEWAWEVKDDI
jgi:hypothetical protein